MFPASLPLWLLTLGPCVDNRQSRSGLGGGKNRELFNGYRVSVLQDEKSSRGKCTAM